MPRHSGTWCAQCNGPCMAPDVHLQKQAPTKHRTAPGAKALAREILKPWGAYVQEHGAERIESLIEEALRRAREAGARVALKNVHAGVKGACCCVPGDYMAGPCSMCEMARSIDKLDPAALAEEAMDA